MSERKYLLRRLLFQRTLIRFCRRVWFVPAGLLALGADCRGGCRKRVGDVAKVDAGARFVPPQPGPARTAPRVLYTDALAGPNSGGENDKGMYLSIFGVGFGASGLGSRVKVFIGGAEVDNYRYIGASRGRPDIQQITVQVGALGNAKAGVPLPVQVVADGIGSNSDHTFTVQPGDFYFVSTRGNDTTALKNDIARPFRMLQTPAEGGVLAFAGAGDVIVLRGGSDVTWSDVGWGNRWLRFRRTTGDAPTGVKGHGYVSIVAYPNEDVHYVPPPNTSGGIHGLAPGYAKYSDWILISGLRIESVASTETDGAPINLHAASDHWRVVNNDLGPWPAPDTARCRAAGVAGNGKAVAILGNHIHHIGGGKENHGIYLDSNASDIDVGYNWIHDVSSGNLIQTYDNLGGSPLSDIRVHHNVIYNGGRYGLNIADGTRSLTAWNNLIYGTALAGVRFSVNADATTAISVLHNTIYDANLATGGGAAPLVNDWKLSAGVAQFRYNIVAVSARSKADRYFADSSDGSGIAFESNLWFGLHGTVPNQDGKAVGKSDRNDPKFVDPKVGNFALLGGSPAIDAAADAIDDDFASVPRPVGTRSDVGAMEFSEPAR